MEIRYYITPETGLPHIYDHGVKEAEIEWILRNPTEDGPGTNDTRQAVGQTEAGRYLRVIYVPDDDGIGIFVITAYPVTGQSLKAFRRRRKKRGQ